MATEEEENEEEKEEAREEHNVFIRSRSLSGPTEQTSECHGPHSAHVLRRMAAAVR